MDDNYEEMSFSDDHDDGLMIMIGDLVGQVTSNYTRTMIASSENDTDQVWRRYHESFALEEDLNSLTKHRIMSMLSDRDRFDKLQ